jgi:hypothetical protein
MDAIALKKLKKSTAHWKRLATKKTKEGESIGISHCACCLKFYHDEKGYCFSCPIKQATGKAYCQDTPWDEIKKLMDSINMDNFIKTEEFIKLAKKELKFLQSLLPKKKK